MVHYHLRLASRRETSEELLELGAMGTEKQEKLHAADEHEKIRGNERSLAERSQIETRRKSKKSVLLASDLPLVQWFVLILHKRRMTP